MEEAFFVFGDALAALTSTKSLGERYPSDQDKLVEPGVGIFDSDN